MASTTADDDLVRRAAAYARDVHRDDVRKGSGQPYFEGHLEPVAAIVAAHGGSPVQVAAAYLHDAAEDHGGWSRLEDIRHLFGDGVGDIVRDLSDSLVDTAVEDKAPWRERKEAYLASLPSKPSASLAVAAADKLHNARSILDDHRRIGDEVWGRFTTASAADQRWYYESLATVLADRLPTHPTVARLRETVTELGARLDAGH